MSFFSYSLLLSFLFFQVSCGILSKKSNTSLHYLNIAISFIEKCDYPTALANLLKAKKHAPNDFIVRHALASLYYQMGEYEESARHFKRVLKLKPKSTDARVDLARNYIALGAPKKALREIEKAEKDLTYGKYLKLVSQKAHAYYEMGEYWKARKWLYEAKSLPGGENPFLFLQLGKTELAVKQYNKSEEFLKKAINFNSQNQSCQKPSYEPHFYLAKLYIAEGKKKEAKYFLNIFIKNTSIKDKKMEEAEKILRQLKV